MHLGQALAKLLSFRLQKISCVTSNLFDLPFLSLSHYLDNNTFFTGLLLKLDEIKDAWPLEVWTQ